MMYVDGPLGLIPRVRVFVFHLNTSQREATAEGGVIDKVNNLSWSSEVFDCLSPSILMLVQWACVECENSTKD